MDTSYIQLRQRTASLEGLKGLALLRLFGLVPLAARRDLEGATALQSRALERLLASRPECIPHTGQAIYDAWSDGSHTGQLRSRPCATEE